MSLDLDTARAIIAGARAHAADAGFKPMTVVVLDAGGHVVAVEREDGSSMKRFEIGFGKAHGALSLGMGSRSIMGRAEQQPYFIAAVTSAVGGALVPVPGGVLVRDGEGALLGPSASPATPRTTTRRPPSRASRAPGSPPRRTDMSRAHGVERGDRGHDDRRRPRSPTVARRLLPEARRASPTAPGCAPTSATGSRTTA